MEEATVCLDDDDLKIAYKAMVEGNTKDALQIFENLVGKGSLDAAIYLGCMYRDGNGVQTDIQEAIKWFSFAAKKNFPLAQFYLARTYYDSENYKEAFHWFSASAKDNFFPSKYWIYIFYKKKLTKDIEKYYALQCLIEAAENGHLYAKRELAVLFIKGEFGLLKIFHGFVILFDIVKNLRKNLKNDNQNWLLRI